MRGKPILPSFFRLRTSRVYHSLQSDILTILKFYSCSLQSFQMSSMPNLYVDLAKYFLFLQLRPFAFSLYYNLLSIAIEAHWSSIVKHFHDFLRHVANELSDKHQLEPIFLLFTTLTWIYLKIFSMELYFSHVCVWCTTEATDRSIRAVTANSD